jgi:hypothetical protein
MSQTPETPDTRPPAATFAKPEALMRVPVGLASPLWGLFAGAAVSGSAWWWMTRWARAENLEAMFGAAAEASPIAAIEEVVEVAVEADAALIEAADPVVADAVLEAAAPEAAPEPEPTALAPVAAADEPEVLARPRTKKAEPKPG